MVERERLKAHRVRMMAKMASKIYREGTSVDVSIERKNEKENGLN